jgi:hypothetical protein
MTRDVCHAPNFAEKTFADGRKSAKFAKVFSLGSFPLYSNLQFWHTWVLTRHIQWFAKPVGGVVYMIVTSVQATAACCYRAKRGLYPARSSFCTASSKTSFLLARVSPAFELTLVNDKLCLAIDRVLLARVSPWLHRRLQGCQTKSQRYRKGIFFCASFIFAKHASRAAIA